MAKILIVDNEINILTILSTVLKAEGYEIVVCKEAAKAKEAMQEGGIELLLSDIRMAPINGMELLRWAKIEHPDVSVIMLTAYGSVETAIEAMKLGAFDYVTKPFKVDELLLTIQRALDYRKALAENSRLKAQFKTRYRFENIVAESPAMKNVCELIDRVAPTDTTVMIYGESGTGKELVAKAIHAYSRRKNGKFLAINCAALPEALLESEMFGHMKGAFTGASVNKKGLFEAAEGGTIFLDEIGAMPLSIQSKLLRVLQDKEIRKVGGTENVSVNARVLAATNVRLEDLVESGRFRQDLYYRLNVIPLQIEPLRKRAEDIMPLVNHFLREELGPTRDPPACDEDVIQIFQKYAWPGNVRELENTVKHALTFARDNRVTRDVLPPRLVSAAETMDISVSSLSQSYQFVSLKAFLKAQEKHYMEQVLKDTRGNKEEAAATLKISLATLYRKLPHQEGAADGLAAAAKPDNGSSGEEPDDPADELDEPPERGEDQA